MCLLALSAAAGLSADAEEQREVERVLAKPIEEFTRRNAAKNAAGFLASWSQRRRVLYFAAPLRPTEQEIAMMPRYVPDDRKSLVEQQTTTALRANLDRAKEGLTALRRAFHETTFIAPWISSVLSG